MDTEVCPIRREPAGIPVCSKIHIMYERRIVSKGMSRTTATIPDDLTDLMEGAVRAGIFENKSDAIRHVLREYFNENQNARIAAAVSLYEDGEITLGTAARLANVNRFEMRDILREEGVELRFGPEDMDAARDEIDAARELE
jgi:predicted HTH domain antitoxin